MIAPAPTAAKTAPDSVETPHAPSAPAVVAVPLAALRGVHPRLYFAIADVARIREHIRTDPEYQAMWEPLLDQARTAPVAARAYTDDKGEQLWLREVCNGIETLAFVHLVTQDPAILRKVETRVRALCGYPTWGQGLGHFTSLPIGHVYAALGLTYDWCYSSLGEDTKQLIRETVLTRGPSYYRCLLDPAGPDRDKILQNHLWVKSCGLATVAFALYDDAPEVLPWIDAVHGRFTAALAALQPDGASHEGYGYWQYGALYILRYAHLSRSMLGISLYDAPWLRHTSRYALAMTTPCASWRHANADPAQPACILSGVDISDSPRYAWYGPTQILRALAREYRDGNAQWLAREYVSAGAANPFGVWLNFAWYDPTMPPTAPHADETLLHFPDMDIVSARSAWDGEASLLTFKCGPVLGHRAASLYSFDPTAGERYINKNNIGHCHPDANSFSFFACGEWQIPNAGYVQRKTAFENTLLVNSIGQLGQDSKKKWWDGSVAPTDGTHPRIVIAASTPGLDHIVGDATSYYAGLQKFVRHLIFIKPDVLVVIDDLAASETSTFDLLFHGEQPLEKVEKQPDGSFLQRGNRSVLRMELLTPEGVTVLPENQRISARHGDGDGSRFLLRQRLQAQAWRTATVFSCAPAGTLPEPVILDRHPHRWRFTVRDQVCELDWETGQATLGR